MESRGFELRGVHLGPNAQQGGAEDALRAFHDHREFVWLHIQVEEVTSAQEFLESEFGFHPLEVEMPSARMNVPPSG